MNTCTTTISRWQKRVSKAAMLMLVAGCINLPTIPGDGDSASQPWWCGETLDRNRYQQGLCPETRPEPGYLDPITGIAFCPFEWWNFYHWPNTCNRGVGGVLDEIEYTPETLEMIEDIGLDVNLLTPCVQCCYDIETDELTDSGSFDFQAPPNLLTFITSPIESLTALQAHGALDMAPFDICTAN